MRWCHPGILALLEDQAFTRDPFEAIRSKARAAVAHAVSLGWSGPPFDVELLASLNGLRIEVVESLGDGRDAACIPGAILVTRRCPPNRRRYSIAHEVVHQFVPSDHGTARFDALPPKRKDAAIGELERLCQVGAAELLLPAAPFQVALATQAVSIPALEALAQMFDVSTEAAARRAVDLHTTPLALAFARPVGEWEPVWAVIARIGAPRGRVGDDDLIVTAWVATPRFSSVRVVHGEPIPRKSCIRRAWGWGRYKPRESRIYRAVEAWPLYPELGKLSVEAAPLPRGKQPIEVLALIRRGEGIQDR